MSEKKGMIGLDFFVSSEQGKYLIVLEPDEVVVLQDKDSDDYKVAILASVFRHNFKTATSLKDAILRDDVSIQIQVDKNKFTKEVQLVVESDRPVKYSVAEGEVAKEDELTKYVPRVIVKEEDNED